MFNILRFKWHCIVMLCVTFIQMPQTFGQANPLDSVPNIRHTLKADSISLNYPEIRLAVACGADGLLDMKMFNDTVFLFIIPDQEDTIDLFTLYHDGEVFRFLEKRPINIQTSPLAFIKPGWTSLTAIHYDTIALIEEHAAYFYDFVHQSLFYTHQLEEHIFFTSHLSPTQTMKGKPLMITEYLDFSNPRNPMGFVETEIYAAIDYQRQQVTPLPFYPTYTQEAKSITYSCHLAIMNDHIIVKHSTLDAFEVLKAFNSETEHQPIVDLGLRSRRSGDPEDPMQLHLLLKAQATSPQQIGMVYSRESDHLFLFYFLPVESSEVHGTRIPTRDVLCLAYDQDFKPVGKVVLQEIKSFFPSRFYAFQDRLFLVSTLEGKVSVQVIQLHIAD
jgi:hypothetical protein